MIDRAISEGLLPPARSRTREFRILENGADRRNKAFLLYGENAAEIQMIVTKEPEKQALIHPELPYAWAEVEWVCKNEMVLHLEDILARRLRALLLNARAAMDVAAEVAEKAAPILGWSKERIREETRAFLEIAKNYMLE